MEKGEPAVRIDAVILARGGSKGYPRKNVRDFCGKPLLTWTVEQALGAARVDDVWVSSDCPEILNVASNSGAKLIHRPQELATDYSTSESGWLHAVEYITEACGEVGIIIGLQATSPLREIVDIENGIEIFLKEELDSLFSCCIAEDICLWTKSKDQGLRSVNYDYRERQRKRRQDLDEQIVENGSFYIFRADQFLEYRNRFFGKIGTCKMEFWKMFEIDSAGDARLCAAIMNEFMLGVNHD